VPTLPCLTQKAESIVYAHTRLISRQPSFYSIGFGGGIVPATNIVSPQSDLVTLSLTGLDLSKYIHTQWQQQEIDTWHTYDAP
jgi:hypothetical protein